MNRAASGRDIAALVSLFLLAFAGRANAQGGATITGRVTNEQGAPLANANVLIPSLNISSSTSATGSYSLTVPASRVSGQQVTLAARFLGYTRQNREITLRAGSQSQDFTLKADPFRLNEVVVTGVANATSAAVVPFSVARVSEE
jgi:hypothetical protein